MGHTRFVCIDIARCIGIVLVVAGHYFPDGSPLWYCGLRHWIYSFHMPLFMFLSGYLFAGSNRNESYLAFLWRKVKRLLIPYLAVSVIIISIKLVCSSVLGIDLKNPVVWNSFVKMLAFPEAAIHLWFVFALWWIFVIAALSKSKRYHIILLVAGFVLHYLPLIAPAVHFPPIFCLDKAAEFLVYFMLAVILYDAGLDLHSPRKSLSAVLLALFVINSIFKCLPFAAEYIGTAGILALSSLLQDLPSKRLKPLLSISEASYTIYLMHSIFIGFIVIAMKAVCPALLEPCNNLFGMGATIIIALTITLCMALHRISVKCRIC